MAPPVTNSPRLRAWFQTATAIATVIIAVLAFLIERELANQELTRASVSRSVALYRDFVSSQSIEELRNKAYQIDHHLWKVRLPEEEIKIEAVKVFSNANIVKDIGSIRQNVSKLLQDIRIIYHCGGFDLDKTNRKHKQLCDRNTIYVLFGAIITELFVVYKPILYCDKFVSERYFDETGTGYVALYEELVLHRITDDFERRGMEDWKVFLTMEKKKKAVEDGILNKDSKHFSILRLPTERCDFYKHQDEISQKLL